MNFSEQLLPLAVNQHHSGQDGGPAGVTCPVGGVLHSCLMFHPLETSSEQEEPATRKSNLPSNCPAPT